jgi:hypothetical protein
MIRTTLLKVTLVVCLAVAGFGVAKPAEAYLHPCDLGYCETNPNCSCKCWEWDEQPYRCDEAPMMCFS